MHSVLGRTLAMALLSMGLGVCLGAAAWGDGRAPVLALALPLAVAFSRTRALAACVAAGYALGTLRYNAAFVATWFDDNLAIGLGIILALAVITALVWCIGWSSSARPARRAAAITVAWILAVLPPATLAVPGHPLVATGYLLPAFGWFGVALSLAAPGSLVWAAARIESLRMRVSLAVGALAVLGALGFLIGGQERPNEVRGVQTIDTAWGMHTGLEDTLLRVENMPKAQVSPHTVTVVWPESILGRYDRATYPVLNLELLGPAKRAGRVHVIGMDIPMPRDRLLNSAVAFYPDGSTATATARQPAPLALWRPWKNEGTFLANWSASNMLNLGQGDRAALIFCFEEYLPVLYLLNEALDQPTVYLALANTWAAKHPQSSAIQTGHSLGMAKLFGRDYLKAENRPSNGRNTNWSPSVAP